ncbi:multidrug-resistance type transporter aminotriazole resistance [Exophiala sideris]|uniref:Multidrug-resistance type transporter aminotriazole resistance n=1 Tax=Exophiala sideris TaxID=1016849 RepID=A0ABR0J9H6_9EURO|nr:multidrug-resistance type transporter aminotriazole resistance [Exophiala sideris]KAK5031586.1 multidrug-resistance type transporter aminotriazole resistance [Exophiala sideris]KAK5058264.1 multidrug-resistance type transporter aminotriazole resistance [Exophiala sideris]KAK5180193.1 multidrug-resistance type transporter aminotriazole resistance [Eurotiomycetes sp. CCFEE 6388]
MANSSDQEAQSPASNDEVAIEKETNPDNGGMSLQQTKSSIAEQMPLGKEILFVAIICLAQFTTQVGLGSTLIILPTIGKSFGLTNPADYSWLIAGYSLTVGTFILLSGRMGDLFGYKRMLLIGFSWYSIWSMVAGLAVYSNHVLFVFARVLQGIGPAITLPNGLALLGATYAPGKRKDMVFSLFGACAPGGSIVGGAFAGVFALAWWPWVFWSLAITLAIIVVVSSYVLPEPPQRSRESLSVRDKIKQLDLPGAIVGITALVLFNFAWNQAPIVGWQKPYVYVLMIIGVLLVPVFFYIELRVSRSPLVPFDALTADVGFVIACIACGWSSFGLILSKLRPAVVMTIALTAFTVGQILIATAPVHQSYWAQTFVCTVIIPWGMDMSFPAATIILSNSVSKRHQGIAASLINTVVNYSISLGLGFAGTVEVHVDRGGKTPEDVLRGYRGAWYLGTGLAGAGLVVSIIFWARGSYKDRKAARSK